MSHLHGAARLPKSTMTENVRLQNLRDFTVQIRDIDAKDIIGTGIVISSDRIITCSHVVNAALGVDPKEAADRKICVYFPMVSSNETKTRYAQVENCPIHHDDDIVTLNLIDGPAPLGPEQIAELGAAEHSVGHAFLSYGYSPTHESPATRADGRILGSVEPPKGKTLHADPIQISSQQVDHGMSGAAVLDTELNLVVGLVSARYFPKTWIKGDIAYAVDAKVLTFDPFCFTLREKAFPLRPAPAMKIDLPKATEPSRKRLIPAWNNALPAIEEWVGRADLMKSITNDWIDSKKRVTGLIGFGGEGKSALARNWIDNLLADKLQPQPEGVFWWGFSNRPSADEFFEAALNYISGGNADLLNMYPSSSAKAHFLGGMLYGGRYLFILDGLEAMQYQEGDQYGLLKSNDLRDFLKYFVNPDHDSFCLVTSRAPLVDLMEFTTYQHRDVDRLILTDGRALLKKLGVKGSDAELDRVVEDWDGHALTLSLLGTYLVERAGGNCTRISEIPSPIADEPRYERVHRVLRAYDEHLMEIERAFLMRFSAFRMAVHESAFEPVFRAKLNGDSLSTSFATIQETEFKEMVGRLVRYRILRNDPGASNYIAHPLIREHYYALLKDLPQVETVHKQIMRYYLAISRDDTNEPSLDDLKPLIEAVHHACCANAYDEAYTIFVERISRPKIYVITKQLGAYETELALLREFFPNGDLDKDPCLSNLGRKNLRRKTIILENVGFCMMSLGLLNKALSFYERANVISRAITDWQTLSNGYQNLARLYLHLGELESGENAAREGLKVADRIRDHSQHKPKNRLKLESKRNSMCWMAWAHHLKGNIEEARSYFREAEAQNRNIYKEDIFLKYLTGFRGIQHADHLRRDGKTRYAQLVIGANMLDCRTSHELPQISRCHRLIGDFETTKEHLEKALENYNTALRVAESIFRNDILIEALLARGRLYGRHMSNAPAAFKDLDDALEHAILGGYRIYEVDIRIGIAWAYFVACERDKARTEAEHAKQMSNDMGYYWGNKDAEELLDKLDQIASQV
jgi:tetratricopeptide (TPR) repeat protein